jgi:hypothetical protein
VVEAEAAVISEETISAGTRAAEAVTLAEAAATSAAEMPAVATSKRRPF